MSDSLTASSATPARGSESAAFGWRSAWLPVTVLSALVLGAVGAQRNAEAARDFWLVTLAVTGGPVVWRTLRDMLRGHFATDVVAMLSILTALALRQPVAGLVIVLMQTGGELLERYAEGRASRAVRELERAAPRVAHRVAADGTIVDIAADDVLAGDALLVRPGEMLPCDGVVTAGSSHLDEARITGEPLPRRVELHSRVVSGAVNGEGALHVCATARAGESLYARIVELVRTAQAQKSPIQRVADKYAAWFTPVTLAVTGLAWEISGDPLRALAVLVVATPCPLILATPVAIVGGINRAARRQIIVRTGAALERIGSVDVAVFDKTGTLTIGRPEVSEVRAIAPWDADTVLRLAASVEQESSHQLARTTVDAALGRGFSLARPQAVVETPGRGVTGRVDGRLVSIGARSYVSESHPTAAVALAAAAERTSGLIACVAIDGAAAGTVSYADRLREDLGPFFRLLAELGVTRTLLVSGDHEENVRQIAGTLGLTELRSDVLPDAKADVVRALMAEGHRVVMVGDGTNDAPALSAATVGIAVAAHGGGISAEAADIVLLADDVTRVAEAMEIGRRATRIARQSIVAGLGLSAVAMAFAAAGSLAPTTGALLQELIDVAVILNALRASSAGRP